jgi:hypothetical protein
MKDILIVFGVLLVLVILISTFGGSVRYQESFEEEPAIKPAADAAPPVMASDAAPPTSITTDGPPPSGRASEMQAPVVEGFDGGAYAGFQEEEEEQQQQYDA